jgi:hypothetical protein
MQLLWTPWKRDLLRLVAGATASVDLAVAYIQLEIMREVLDAAPEGVQLRVLARQNGSDFRSGIANLATFELLSSLGPNARVMDCLHAKLLVVDQQVAALGSSNLTSRGLETNKEAGLLVEESCLVSEICRHYEDWWKAAKPLDYPALSSLVARLPRAPIESREIEGTITRLAIPAGGGPSTRVTFAFTIGAAFLNPAYGHPITIPKECHKGVTEILRKEGLNLPAEAAFVCHDGSQMRGRIRYGPEEKAGEFGAYYQISARGGSWWDPISRLRIGQRLMVEVSGMGGRVGVSIHLAPQ